MALVLKDRVKETTATTGTGSLLLAGPVAAFQPFSVIGEGNTTYYTIVDQTQWEVGIGTYSNGFLSRDTVISSSQNGSKISLGNGAKDVFCTMPGPKAVGTDTLPFVGVVDTATLNATVNVASLTAQTTSTNGDLVLAPKGTGALSTTIPNGAASGGNKRGLNAIDLQRTRTLAALVASGTESVIAGGTSNKASGDYSAVGGGATNEATGLSSVVAGGLSNIASGLFASAGGGNSNVISGSGAAIPGGSNNVASGQYASVTSGSSNTASGDNSFVVGGDNNLADARFAGVVGGIYGTTRGIVGYIVTPASEVPIEAKAGVQQSGCLLLGVQTSNATPTKLRSDYNAAGATNQLILQNNSAAMLFIDLVGWDKTDYITVNIINGLIVRGANAASTVLKSPGYQNYEKSTGASSWTIALSADTTNGGLIITVTGQASKTIRWVARVFATEVGF